MSRTGLLVSLLSFAVGPLSLSAQSAAPAAGPTAAQFLLPDSENLVVVDLALMRESGLWQQLEQCKLASSLRRIEKVIELPLSGLDRVQLSVHVPDGADPAGCRRVLLWQGARATEVMGADEVMRLMEQVFGGAAGGPRSRRPELFLRIRPTMTVLGDTTLVRAVAEGRGVATPTSPQLASLLSGRERRLALFVVRFDQALYRERFLEQALGAELASWPESDLPTHGSLQLSVAQRAEGPRLVLRLVLRHDQHGEGVAASLAAIDAAIAGLRDDPRVAPVCSLLEGVAAEAEHGDAVLQLDLGPMAEAAGRLAVLLAPVLGDDGGAEVGERAGR